MDDGIEILSEKVRKVERGPAVASHWAINLNNGNLVTAHPSHDVRRKFMCVVAATVPDSRAHHLADGRRKAEYPRHFLLLDASH